MGVCEIRYRPQHVFVVRRTNIFLFHKQINTTHVPFVRRRLPTNRVLNSIAQTYACYVKVKRVHIVILPSCLKNSPCVSLLVATADVAPPESSFAGTM